MDRKEKKFEYLLSTNLELRDELKMRIRQRDSFGIQFVIAIGALLSIIMTSDSDYAPYLVFLIPVVTLFYSTQIMSSYSVHERLSYFIREKIENEIAKEIKEEEHPDLFWENYCKYDRSIHKVKLPGIRKSFFVRAMFLVPILSFGIFGSKVIDNVGHIDLIHTIVSVLATLFFMLISYYVYYSFERKPHKMELENYSSVDYLNTKAVDKKVKKAVFFDRDGTIHVDKVMTREVKDLEFFEDTIDTIKEYQNNGYHIVIITNQSGIGKGSYTVKKMHKFNMHLLKELKKNGCEIDAIYYCPHRSDEGCRCHKPNTGMIERAIKELTIDAEKSILIGDRMSDIKAGVEAGIGENYVVTTGIYENDDFNTEPYLEELKGRYKKINCLKEALNDLD